MAVGLAITLFVLLIDASLHSRSQSPGRQLAAGAWYDRVLPIITSSSTEGRLVAGVWTRGPGQKPAAVASVINQVAAGASQDYQDVLKVRPPPDLTGQAGLLEACLLARSEAAGALRSAFAQTLGSVFTGQGTSTATSTTTTTPASATAAAGSTSGSSSVPAPALQELQAAMSRIQVGDQAYQLFSSTMPSSLGLHIPSSTWLTDQAPYQPQNAQIFLATLQSAAATTPVHQVKIYSVSTTPGAVTTKGSLQVLPDARAMTVTLVVADTGNQPESNLTVTAAISPASAGTSSVRDFLDLQPGEAHSIVGLGPLNPQWGPTVTLTITVTGPSGSPTPQITSRVYFQMPPPPPPSTTTTTTLRPTSTPGG